MRWKGSVAAGERLRELKKIELVKAACSYFTKSGYHGTSLADIANALGLTKSAIYYYFPDKQTVLFDCSKWAHTSLLSLSDGDGPDPLGRLRKLCREYARYIAENQLGFIMFVDLGLLERRQRSDIVRLRDLFELRIRGLLDESARSGAIRPVNAKTVSLLLLGALNWMPRWHRPDGERGADAFAEDFFDVLLEGLRPSNPPSAAT
jgi:AcrR family transcriptional regulator